MTIGEICVLPLHCTIFTSHFIFRYVQLHDSENITRESLTICSHQHPSQCHRPQRSTNEPPTLDVMVIEPCVFLIKCVYSRSRLQRINIYICAKLTRCCKRLFTVNKLCHINVNDFDAEKSVRCNRTCCKRNPV